MQVIIQPDIQLYSNYGTVIR